MLRACADGLWEGVWPIWLGKVLGPFWAPPTRRSALQVLEVGRKVPLHSGGGGGSQPAHDSLAQHLAVKGLPSGVHDPERVEGLSYGADLGIPPTLHGITWHCWCGPLIPLHPVLSGRKFLCLAHTTVGVMLSLPDGQPSMHIICNSAPWVIPI